MDDLFSVHSVVISPDVTGFVATSFLELTETFEGTRAAVAALEEEPVAAAVRMADVTFDFDASEEFEFQVHNTAVTTL
jgi:hypothetical protein